MPGSSRRAQRQLAQPMLVNMSRELPGRSSKRRSASKSVSSRLGTILFLTDVKWMASGVVTMRRFLRHPSDMPVELVQRKHAFLPRQRLNNISLGGVACNSDKGFRKGTAVELRIPLLGEQARYPGVVAWCRKQAEGYLVGIAFIDEDTLFRARMV